MHERHRSSVCRAGQLDGSYALPRTLIHSKEAGLSSSALAMHEKATGDHCGCVGWLTCVGQIQPLQSGMVLDSLRGVSVGSPPEMLARVHVDGCDSSVGGLEDRETLGSSKTSRNRLVMPIHYCPTRLTSQDGIPVLARNEHEG